MYRERNKVDNGNSRKRDNADNQDDNDDNKNKL